MVNSLRVLSCILTREYVPGERSWRLDTWQQWLTLQIATEQGCSGQLAHCGSIWFHHVSLGELVRNGPATGRRGSAAPVRHRAAFFRSNSRFYVDASRFRQLAFRAIGPEAVRLHPPAIAVSRQLSLVVFENSQTWTGSPSAPEATVSEVDE